MDEVNIFPSEILCIIDQGDDDDLHLNGVRILDWKNKALVAENAEEEAACLLMTGRMTQKNNVNRLTGLSELGRKPL